MTPARVRLLRAGRLAVALAAAAVSLRAAPPAGSAPSAAGPAPVPGLPRLPAAVQAFVRGHCLDCHDAAVTKGGLDLSALPAGDTDVAAHQRWVRVFDRVARGEMPPKDEPRPAAAEHATFLAALGPDLSAQHAARRGTVLRRLNRREYQHTVNDLLGLDLDLQARLPEDGLSHGFDTVGEALGVSGIQLQRYLEAAEFALDALFRGVDRPPSKTERHTLESERNEVHLGKHWLRRPDGAIVVFNAGGFPSTQLPAFRAAAPGRYRVRIDGYGYQIAEPVPFAVITGTFNRGGDQTVHGYFEVPRDRPGTVELEVTLRTGDGLKLAPQGLNGPDGHSPIKDGPDKYPGEGFALRHVEIEGPLHAEWPLRGRRLLLGDVPLREVPPANPRARQRPDYRPVLVAESRDPAGDARTALQAFLPRAFRRPVDAAGVAPYLALFEREFAASRDYLLALRTAVAAALCAPEFLYLREPAGRLDAHALAARLSYFLTRTAPDDELRALAAAGTLTQPEILRAQTERLLRGPGLDRFVADFTDGWLNLREIEFTTPDKLLYPEFDDLLLHSMLRETRGFIRELFAADLGLDHLVRSDFAILNSRLARHYGLPPVEGIALRRVPLPPDSRRGGLLTQASILKVSANGTNTSPVVRGVWVNDRLLGRPPQPPPPGTPGVEPDTRGAKTLREILAAHRSVESCNGCHREIDPPGFALESYDVIGGWRDRFRTLAPTGTQVRLRVEGRNVRYRLGPPVDAAGELPSGETFADFAGFQRLLLARGDDIVRCVAEKLLTFATGRELGFSDRPELDRLVAASKAGGHRARNLLHLVVQSPLFLSK